MQKVPTIFERDEAVRGHPVKNVIKPECAWVLNGEGVPTRKLDGTNVKIHAGRLYKRQKPLTGDYTDASYVEASRDNPGDRYIFEAVDRSGAKADGIYEVVGPKIQGNPEGFGAHQMYLIYPQVDPVLVIPNAELERSFEGFMAYMVSGHIEGIVFHHADGRLAKIKARDYGISRRPRLG